MATNKTLTIGFWGLLFMVSFLYAKNLTFTLSAIPLPGDPERYGNRIGTHRNVPMIISQTLWVFSYPLMQNAHYFAPDEPYYFELVYRPYLAAFQWFGYGCLFGWWRYRRKSRRSST